MQLVSEVFQSILQNVESFYACSTFEAISATATQERI
jgi:hypothetical protein